MVDGSMNLSKAPETNRTDGGNLRRFSTGKASSLSIDEQRISSERRSSTGSCHDFCKYGHKHSLETKARVPLLKRAMKKSLDGQKSNQVVAVPETEKPSVRVTKLKASPGSGTCITGGTDVVKQVVPINSPTMRSQVEIEVMMNESKELVVPVNSPTRQSPVDIEVTSESKGQLVPESSPGRQSSIETEVMNESKELLVPVNSHIRRSPVEIEFMNESNELIVPVNSPSRQSPVEIEVTSKSKGRVVPESSPRRQRPIQTEVMNESKELVVPVNSHCRRIPVKSEVMNESKELVVPKNSNSPSRRSPVKSEVMNESKELVTKTKTMPKTHKPKIHKTTKQVVFSSTKSESSPKQALTNIGEAGRDSLSKPRALKAKSLTSSGSSGNIAVHRDNSSKTGEGASTSKGNGTEVAGNPIVISDPKSVDAVANLPAMKNKNSKVVSRVISQNKTRRAQTKETPNVESLEKTLSVINMETKKTKVVESDQNEKHALKGCPKSPSSLYKPSSLADGPSLSPHKKDRGGTKFIVPRSEANATFSGPKKHGGIKKEEADNGNKKGRLSRTLQTKGKDSSSLNINFRNGKVVDLHSDSHGPRRLKFMRGRSLGDNQKSKDGQRTSFKKVVVKGISKDSIPSSEKVALRHQDVQGKKDTQVLFNNVIAETARKLVRTRKSKVKALVGAFEKVISLQDKKPSVRATA